VESLLTAVSAESGTVDRRARIRPASPQSVKGVCVRGGSEKDRVGRSPSPLYRWVRRGR
jgi:hypothetical protein